MNNNKIFIGAVMVLAVLFAIVIGGNVAEGNISRLGMYAGIALAAIGAFGLRTSVWVLIPICYGLGGSLGGGRLPISVQELAVLFCFGLFIVFKALKAVPPFPKLNFCDKLLIINLIYLSTVFFRNPVGVEFMRSSLIGGRPYFEIFIACCGFWVLQHVALKPKLATWLPALFCIGSIINAASGFIAQFAPGVGARLGMLYSGFLPAQNAGPALQLVDSSVTRHEYLAGFGVNVGRAVVSYLSVFKLIFFQNFFLSSFFYLSAVAILFSGFRSNLIGWVFAAGLASYLRGGLRAVFPLVATGLAGVVMLVVMQTAGLQVPLAAQRALSFIPAPWDQRAAGNAKSTVEWRVEMWQLALTSDRYIKDKLLGDGFGFDPSELRGWASMSAMRLSTSSGLQDYFMITGDYHSGPVSSIRFVGYFGLFLITALLIGIAIYAGKIIRMSRGSVFFPLALFFGISAIYQPLCFWLIYGAYGEDFVQIIFTLGMLNLIDRSIKKEKPTKLLDQG